jgi:GTP-binding protein EngB required for normal cell division
MSFDSSKVPKYIFGTYAILLGSYITWKFISSCIWGPNKPTGPVFEPETRTIEYPKLPSIDYGTFEHKEDMTALKVEPHTTLTIDEIPETISVSRTQIYNVILIGESRAGKTQFIRSVEDIMSKAGRVFYAGTKNPQTEKLILKISNEYITINFIDTPGINELAINGFKRTNRELQDMIAKFVKEDVTMVNMIIVVWNGQDQFTARQIEALVEMVLVVGKGMNANSAVMVTHYERMNEKDEDDWFKSFTSHPYTKTLAYATQLGVFFTGAIDESFKSSDVVETDKFKINQMRRIKKFLNTLVSVPPKPLRIQIGEEVKGVFDLDESLQADYKKSCENVDTIPRLRQTVEELRMRCSRNFDKFKSVTDPPQLPQINRRAEQILPQVGNDKLTQEFKMPEDVHDRIRQYKADATFLRDFMTKSMRYYRFLSSARDELKTISDQYEIIVGGTSPAKVRLVPDEDDDSDLVVYKEVDDSPGEEGHGKK